MNKMKIIHTVKSDANQPEIINYVEELGANLPMRAPKPKKSAAFLSVVLAVIVAVCIYMWPDNEVIDEPVQEQSAEYIETLNVLHHVYTKDRERVGTYEGEVTDEGYPIGEGLVWLGDEISCEGLWEAGPIEGETYKVSFENGGLYEGTISSDYLPFGSGVYYGHERDHIVLNDVKWVNNKEIGTTRYTGMVNGGILFGYGTAYLEGNKEYTGDFENGAFNGLGYYVEKTEDDEKLNEYEGYFENNAYNGMGKFTKYGADEIILQVCNGEFADNEFMYGLFLKFDESGKMLTTYEGGIHDGYLQGQGDLVWEELGCRYKGTLEYNNPNGYGTFYYVEGESIEGMWEWVYDEGVNVGVDGKYTGMLLDGVPCGYGSFVRSDGKLRLEGEFKNGDIYGWVLIYEDGKEPYPYRHIEGEQYTTQPCQINMELKLNGKTIVEGSVYEVQPGDKVDITAEGTVAPIERIGYYSNLNTEICDTYSDVVSYELPECEAGKCLHLYVEAIAENDDGTPNTVTKTGWRHYILQY